MSMPVRFLRPLKAQTKVVELTVEKNDLVVTYYHLDSKGKASPPIFDRRKGTSPAEAAARLLRLAPVFVKQKYVLDEKGAPMPKAAALPGVIGRLDALTFPWKKGLQPGASPSLLAELQKKTPLPPLLAQLLSWRNGTGLGGGGFRCWSQLWKLMTTSDIATHHAILKKVAKIDFVPFADNQSGDYLCIDTKGAVRHGNKAGKKGQVVLVWRDEDPQPIHAGFEAWLSTLVEAIEAGVFKKGESAWRAVHAKKNPGYALP